MQRALRAVGLALIAACASEPERLELLISPPDEASVPPVPARLLLLGDSIFYSPNYLWPNIQQDASSEWQPLVIDGGAYSGATAGAGLVELADETYAYEGGVWVLRSRGVPFSAYDALVFSYGANDAGQRLDVFERAYDRILYQARKAGIRSVCAGTPPPKATTDLSAWTTDDGQRSYEFSGFYDAAKASWARWDAAGMDTIARFRGLTASGTYTVSDLMSDAVHPTHLAGANEEATLIASCATAQHPIRIDASPLVAGRLVNDLFGEPVVGTWTLVAVTPGGSVPGRLNRIAEYTTETVLQASELGAVVRFRPHAAQLIWLTYYTDSISAGTVRVKIDGVVTGILNTKLTVVMHPVTQVVAIDLQPGDHVLELETTSADPVRIVGATFLGEP